MVCEQFGIYHIKLSVDRCFVSDNKYIRSKTVQHREGMISKGPNRMNKAGLFLQKWNEKGGLGVARRNYNYNSLLWPHDDV